MGFFSDVPAIAPTCRPIGRHVCLRASGCAWTIRTPISASFAQPGNLDRLQARVDLAFPQIDPEVVVRPSADARGATATRRLEEDIDDSSYVALGEASVLFRRESLQRTRTAFADLRRHLIGVAFRLGAGTRGVCERVDIGDGESLDMFEGTEKVLVGLSGKTADDVRPDPAIRYTLGDTGDEIRELPRPISPLHPRENPIAATLEGNVKVPREFR